MRYKDSFILGQEKAREFYQLCRRRGVSVKVSNRKQDTFDHIDAFLDFGDRKYSIDFKAQKKKNRRGSILPDGVTWVEILNVKGNKGWLHGKADFIVFEQKNKYVFVRRHRLVDFVNEKIEEYGGKKGKELYHLYDREAFGRSDLMTLIDLNDFQEFYGKKLYFIEKD